MLATALESDDQHAVESGWAANDSANQGAALVGSVALLRTLPITRVLSQ